ncbi:MAG: hypothetical protein KA186_05120 [Flavobacteriales bacterium]|nr:hypothetical protein [Flavobacteriales bacterium]
MDQGTPGKHPDSFDLIQFLWSNRRTILIVTAFGAVVGLIAAFVITPTYKSEVIMFPAVTNSASKSLLSENATGRDDILALGDDGDSEQLIQVLNSDKIRERTTEKFGLYDVYEIDEDSKHRNTELQESFEDHISFARTKFSSVRIRVMDIDPVRAAGIANFIADEVDTVWKEMVHERADKGVLLVEGKLRQLEQEMQVMTDSMGVLRNLGVHDYHTQTERFNEYLGAAIVKGDQRAIRELEERFAVLARYGGPYITLQDQLNQDAKRINVLRSKLEQAQVDLESDLPHKFVVSSAKPADRKHAPVRSLVVIGSTLSAFLLSLLLIVVQQTIPKLRNAHGQ